MKKYNICVLIEERIQGGFQKVAVKEVIEFNRMGHKAYLGVLRKSNQMGYEDLVKENNIKVVYFDEYIPKLFRFNFKFPFFEYLSFYHLSYAIFMPFFVKNKLPEFDFMVAHGTYTSFSGIKIAKRLQKPILSFVHDSIGYILSNKYNDKFLGKIKFFTLPFAKLFDKWIIKNSNKTIVYSNMYSYLQKEVKNLNMKNIIKLHNGVDLITGSEINYIKENYAISVTKWDKSKNIELLLDIWIKGNFNMKLKIVGTWFDEIYKNEIISLIRKKKLESKIEIIGEVSEMDLAEYYKNAKLLVHPCTEAFGMSVLEAAASGCPSLISKQSGVLRLFPNKLIEIMPNENDIDAFIRLINKINSLSKDEYQFLCNEFYKTAKQNSWHNHCQKILDNSQELLNKDSKVIFSDTKKG